MGGRASRLVSGGGDSERRAAGRRRAQSKTPSLPHLSRLCRPHPAAQGEQGARLAGRPSRTLYSSVEGRLGSSKMCWLHAVRAG